MPSLEWNQHYSVSTLSWQVKKMQITLSLLHAIVAGLALIDLCARRCLPYLKFGVAEAANAVRFELHTFRIFRIRACPAAFVSASLGMEIHVTPYF